MNKNLVSIQNGEVVTSSLQVAQVFNMQHKNVLQAIRNIECSREFTELNFQPCLYISELRNGVQKQNPMYYMTKDGFTFLVMGFTGKQAAKFKEDYINAFNRMEQHIKNSQSKEVGDIKNRKSEKISAESMKRNLRMMHEQLFANMDNMGMLFNPISLQVNSFAWDDTRSVRANLREFINNYYRLVVISAGALKEQQNNTSLYDYIENRVKSITINLKEAQQEYAKKYGIDNMIISDITAGCLWSDRMSKKNNIDNLLSLFTNNTLSGMFQTYKALKYENEAMRYKEELQRITNDLRSLGILPR